STNRGRRRTTARVADRPAERCPSEGGGRSGSRGGPPTPWHGRPVAYTARPMHVHFVAVAGTGMGALAGLFKSAGHDVSGSDTAFSPPMGPALERWGIRLMTGFDPAHLVPRPDLVVVGNVCRPSNPEAKAAREGGLATTTMAHALAEHILPG